MAYSPLTTTDDHDLLLEKLQPFKMQGRDKLGRRILLVVARFFPARLMSEEGGESAIRGYLERRIIPEIAGEPFVVVYFHTRVRRAENFPGVGALRSLYERLPSAVRDGITAVHFVHPGLQSRLFLATVGRFLFSSGLYRKVGYVSRLEYLWEHVRRGALEVPEFVREHDEELERRPLMDYGLEAAVDHRIYDAPAMDSAASLYSLRCAS